MLFLPFCLFFFYYYLSIFVVFFSIGLFFSFSLWKQSLPLDVLRVQGCEVDKVGAEPVQDRAEGQPVLPAGAHVADLNKDDLCKPSFEVHLFL